MQNPYIAYIKSVWLIKDDDAADLGLFTASSEKRLFYESIKDKGE